MFVSSSSVRWNAEGILIHNQAVLCYPCKQGAKRLLFYVLAYPISHGKDKASGAEVDIFRLANTHQPLVYGTRVWLSKRAVQSSKRSSLIAHHAIRIAYYHTQSSSCAVPELPAYCWTNSVTQQLTVSHSVKLARQGHTLPFRSRVATLSRV